MEPCRLLSHSNQIYLDGLGVHRTVNIKDDNPLIPVCPTCKSNSNSMILDASIGETFCSHCGTVVEHTCTILEKDPETNSRTGMPNSLAFADKGLYTVITKSNRDAFGTTLNQHQISNVNKIRYLDKISYSSKTKIKNLTRAFTIMSTIRDKLTFSDSVIERSAFYYRKALENNMMRGRSIKGMVVASVYASCKEMSVPRRLDELAMAANANYPFAGKCYRLMARDLKIRYSTIDAARYISKIADNAGVSHTTCRRALDILNILKKNPISCGKDPKALATAVLYVASLLGREENVSQTRTAQAGGISTVTLRKRGYDILKLFPEIEISKLNNRRQQEKI